MFLTWIHWGFPHHIFFPSNFSSHKVFPSPSFRQFYKIVESGRNYNKIPLSSGEEKHVDTYMVMNTTRNKARRKYSKEVS